MKKHTEVITVEHKDIAVTIHINYDKGELTLVENGNFGGFNKKSWVFANITLGYMNGWLNILDAMKYAIEYGKKQLEHDLAEKTKFAEKDIDEMRVALSKPKVKKGRF